MVSKSIYKVTLKGSKTLEDELITVPDEELTPATDFLRKMVELRPGGEHRHEQEVALRAVEDAIENNSHLLSQAGTGTGKGLSYLIPAVLSGKKVSVLTATKQLSEQLVDKDIPELNKSLQKLGHSPVRYALLKGRDNYLCSRKYEELKGLEEKAAEFSSSKQDGLFELDVDSITDKRHKKIAERQKEVQSLYKWAETTKTGDRSHAPATSDEVWKQMSSTNTECPGKSACPFGEVCFAEKARDVARVADLNVSNHAVAGVDFLSEESSLLGERDIYIFDELHELDNYLSSAWGTTISAKTIADVANTVRKSAKGEKEVEELATQIGKLAEGLSFHLDASEKGLIDHLSVELEALLITAHDQLERLNLRVAHLSESASEVKKMSYKSATNAMTEVLSSLDRFLVYSPESNIRWISKVKKKDEDELTFLNCSPMRIGPKLMETMEARNAIMIGTSATISVGGNFDLAVHNYSLDEALEAGDKPRPFKTIDAGTPFDYKKQGMMYFPDANNFPTPTGSREDRQEHTDAVQAANLEFVQAAGGRSLLLMTTSFAAYEMGKFLRAKLGKKSKIKVFVQGESPNSQLVESFKNDETSVLVATMGMWQGLDIPGKSCSFVGIDKIPFSPFDDPKAKARQDYATKNGRNGFMEVYVGSAALRLAQGVGRLVRGKSDRGVVAVYDTRLLTARYGSYIINSLPAFGIYTDKDMVLAALKRVVDS